MRQIEIDYVQVANSIRKANPSARFKGREMLNLIKQAISNRARPGTHVLLVNGPGTILKVDGGRTYLVTRDGSLQQLSGPKVEHPAAEAEAPDSIPEAGTSPEEPPGEAPGVEAAPG